MNEKFIDADFVDAEDNDTNTEEKFINGEPLFFTTSQVSRILNVPVSTVRLYTKRFNELLDIELSNKNNQYKKTDIEKLRFILKLTKDEGLTLQQARDYCTRKGFNLDDIEKAVMDSNNPLALQTFITATTMEMDKKLDSFADKLLNRIETKQQQNNEYLQETILGTVEDIITEKLDLSVIHQIKSQEELKDYISLTLEESFKAQTDDIKSNMDALEQQTMQNILEKEEIMKQHMEQKQNYQKLLEDIQLQNKNKSLWQRIRNK